MEPSACKNNFDEDDNSSTRSWSRAPRWRIAGRDSAETLRGAARIHGWKKLRPLPAAAAAVEKEGEEVGGDKNIDGKRL